MQITFDPHDPKEVATVRRLLVAEESKSLDVVLNVQTAHAEAHIAALMDSIGDRLAGGVTVSEDHEDALGGKPSGPWYWLCQHDGTVIETRRDETLGVGFAPITAAEREKYLEDRTLPEHLTAYLEEPRDFPPAEEVFKPDPAVAAAFAPDASASDMPALGGDDEDQVGEHDHAQTAAGDLDSAGLPWDSRIHASTRTKLKADGRWKPKRGVDPATVATVEAELRALMAIPAPTAAGAAPVPPPPPPAVPLPPAGAVAVPPPPPPAAVAVGDAPQTFAQFMQWLGPQLAAGTLVRETVLEAAKAEGLPSVEKLVSRPDLIPLVYARLQP